jgi:aryl-alcohol dehydrogenase-like predicted oxidoreductase
MEHRQFGTTDFRVSPMGIGCHSMSGKYGPAEDNESIATLHRAFDLGINFLDTSSSYGNGHNQELIAKALKGRREKIVVHSKTGSPRGPGSGSAPEYLIANCEESLKRLGVDTLDIFCMSRVDRDIPIEESVGGMARLVEQGKARYIALSEASPISIQRANKIHPIVSLQMEYSLWTRDPEAGNIQACRKFGMGFMAYAPVGRGFFTGAFRDPNDVPENQRNHPRLQPGNAERNFQLLSQFTEFCKEKSATPAQIALAWLMAQGADVIPIPSNKSRAHMEENAKSVEIKLTEADLARLNVMFPLGAAAGPRSSGMHRLNV